MVKTLERLTGSAEQVDERLRAAVLTDEEIEALLAAEETDDDSDR